LNFEKLYEMQKTLMERIEKEHPPMVGEDRLKKRLLALLTEVGECANEWRGFKFWSVNQLPHTSAARIINQDGKEFEFYNPLLEEYVDGLHFILELGIILDVTFYSQEIEPFITNSIEYQFLKVYREITNLWLDEVFYLELLNAYVGLGEMLGFSRVDIEKAYFEKNAINHKRQEQGY
jgi:dimeric dUTPase (all-alpha-NTP-PPase superfamily)